MGYRSTNTIFITAAPLEVGPQVADSGTVTVGFSTRATPKKVKALTGRCAVGFGARSGVDAESVGLGFTHVTVTRDYDLADGREPAGTVYFTPSDWLVNSGVIIPAAAVAAALDVNGRIVASLAANTDLATVPAGSYYTVREEIVGQPVRSYRVIVPHAFGALVDLGALAEAYPSTLLGGYGLGGYGTSEYGV